MSASLSTYSYKYEMSQRFDRATFSPDGNPVHAAILRRLRKPGRGRRWWFGLRGDGWRFHFPHHRGCCASAGLHALDLHARAPGVYVDLGCGDSADAAVAAEQGHTTFGVDLFPPAPGDVRPEDVAQFRQGDVARRIPFPGDFINYATSQAVIALIEPEARVGFYAEVHRTLAPGGLFALNGLHLANGYGFDRAAERRRCKIAGLEYVDYRTTVMIFKKAGTTAP
jgi:SAM-dependent methyltransferase